MRIILCSLLVFSLISCKEDKLSIIKAGELGFRRSYSDIQFRDMSDQELDSIEKSNPRPENPNNSQQDYLLMFHLQKEGILDSSSNLIRSKFPETVPQQFELINQNRKQQHIGIFPRVPGQVTNTYNLVLTNKKQKVVYELEANYGGTSRDISYLLLDLIPGGYPEIVLLNEYYFMNGDCSHLFIYKVTD